jgi:hypothetical protein
MVRRITDEEIEGYRTDGFVKLPGLLEPAELPPLRAAIDEQLAHPGPFGSVQRFATDRCFSLDRPALRRWIVDPTMGENAARAMGSTEARFFFDHLFAFEPNQPIDEHYWHQDQPYWPIEGEQIVSFWVTFTACTAASAALKFVRGSHRDPRFYTPRGFDGDLPPDDVGDRAALAVDVRDQFRDEPPPAFHEPDSPGEVVEYDFAAGDAVMFHTRAVHSSGGNHSPTDERIALSLRYMGDDARMMLRRGVFQDPALLPDADEPFAVGAPMRSRKWPLVHPQPGR